MLTKRNVLGLMRSKRFQRQHGILPSMRLRRPKDPEFYERLKNWQWSNDENDTDENSKPPSD